MGKKRGIWNVDWVTLVEKSIIKWIDLIGLVWIIIDIVSEHGNYCAGSTPGFDLNRPPDQCPQQSRRNTNGHQYSHHLHLANHIRLRHKST